MQYNPQTSIALLAITRNRLRYWRESLDLKPYRKTYSPKVLLLYRLIKDLTERCGYSVSQLQRANLEQLFSQIEEFEWTCLSKCYVSVDLVEQAATIVTHEELPSKADLLVRHASYFPLASLIEEQQQAFWSE